MPTSRRSDPGGDEILATVLPLRDALCFPGSVHSLHIAREASKRAIRLALERGEPMACLAQRDPAQENPGAKGLFRFGTLCDILQVSPLPDGGLRAVVRGASRIAVRSIQARGQYLVAKCTPVESTAVPSEELEALVRLCIGEFHRLIELNKSIPPETGELAGFAERPSELGDALANHLPISLAAKQRLLEIQDAGERLQAVLQTLRHELRLLEIQREVVEQVDRTFGASQREYYLREQLRAIQRELGDTDSEWETEDWRSRLQSAEVPPSLMAKLETDLRKLERYPSSTAEGGVLRNHLDWIASLPWSRSTLDRLDLAEARRTLDARHYGLAAAKERILEYLAVRKLSASLRGPILCFTGPPGVGKTSAAMSIAETLGREFVRISLGGVRDEAEIRGHRRTYVGSMPGQILRGLRNCGSKNPVVLLDEIDKISRDYRGDPAGALLEALDPALNREFVDHYIEYPFDLSEALYVATANTTDGIMPALLDRMEIVEFPSYTPNERLRIAHDFILPRSAADHGLGPNQLQWTPDAVEALVAEYVLEPGVRQLEQRVAAVCRKAAMAIVGGEKSILVDRDRLSEWIGPCDSHRIDDRLPRVGRCMGLAVSALGGIALPVEAALMDRAGSGPEIKITGNLGEVMRESAHAAHTFLRANRSQLRLHGDLTGDVHIHVGEGGLPKDGPSAGLAVALALHSAASGEPLAGTLAASGEIGLHGDVRPVGGIREKLIAARQAGMQTVLLPARNETEVHALPAEVWEGLDVRFVDSITTAIGVVRPRRRESAR